MIILILGLSMLSTKKSTIRAYKIILKLFYFTFLFGKVDKTKTQNLIILLLNNIKVRVFLKVPGTWMLRQSQRIQ